MSFNHLCWVQNNSKVPRGGGVYHAQWFGVINLENLDWFGGKKFEQNVLFFGDSYTKTKICSETHFSKTLKQGTLREMHPSMII